MLRLGLQASHHRPLMLDGTCYSRQNPRPTNPGDGAKPASTNIRKRVEQLIFCAFEFPQFAALAANGVLGVSPDAASNVPSASLQSPYYHPQFSNPDKPTHPHSWPNSIVVTLYYSLPVTKSFLHAQILYGHDIPLRSMHRMTREIIDR